MSYSTDLVQTPREVLHGYLAMSVGEYRAQRCDDTSRGIILIPREVQRFEGIGREGHIDGTLRGIVYPPHEVRRIGRREV